MRTTDFSIIVAKIALWVIIIGITLSVFFMLRITPTNCGFDEECFIKKAANCQPAILVQNINGTVIEYRISGECILSKKIKVFNDRELPEVVRMLRGKDMHCEYKKGEFDKRLINGLLGGITNCKGALKQSIYDLKLADYIITYS